jgi:hypothetical protein
MQEQIILLVKAVFIQLVGVLGIFFVFGFLLAKLQEATQRIYERTVGWKGILWTAWIGTPIHELGHAFFAILFRHKITRLSLFHPNEATGELGQVEHSFKKYSFWPRLGNFFIGAAPLIFGSIILVVLLYFLLPNGKQIFLPLTNNGHIITSVLNTLRNLFNYNNLHTWQFWVFLYLSFCIASHLAPSKVDRKGMWGGLVWIVLLLILINIITLLLGINATDYILRINQYLGIFTAIFVYTLIISTIHFIFAWVVLRPFRH